MCFNYITSQFTFGINYLLDWTVDSTVFGEGNVFLWSYYRTYFFCFLLRNCDWTKFFLIFSKTYLFENFSKLNICEYWIVQFSFLYREQLSCVINFGRQRHFCRFHQAYFYIFLHNINIFYALVFPIFLPRIQIKLDG